MSCSMGRVASTVRTRTTRRAPGNPDLGRRKVGGAPLTFLLSLLAAAVIAMVALRLLGIDGDHVMVVLLAGTPYAAGGGALLVLFAMLLRRWAVAVVALAFTACLFAAVGPRAFTAPRPLGVGPTTPTSVIEGKNRLPAPGPHNVFGQAGSVHPLMQRIVLAE